MTQMYYFCTSRIYSRVAEKGYLLGNRASSIKKSQELLIANPVDISILFDLYLYQLKLI